MECNREKNRTVCSCTYEPCPRKPRPKDAGWSTEGICCECIAYHREMDELPGCVFPPAVERTYDRSITRFVSCKQTQDGVPTSYGGKR